MNQNDITDAELTLFQQYLMRKFSAYRRGEMARFDQQDPATLVAYARLRPPMRLHWVDTEMPTPENLALRQTLRNLNRSKVELRRFREPPAGQQVPRTVVPALAKALSRQQMRDVARLLSAQRIKYCKTLGWGGMGVATLWKYQPNRRRGQKGIVIKSSIMVSNDMIDTSTMTQEKMFLRILARSPHIMQLQFLQTLGTAGLTNTRNYLQEDNRIIMTEFAKLGTLEKWLRRAGSIGILGRRQHYPRVVAWRFFDCLTKACIAMEYPPRHQSANRSAPGDQLPLPMVPPDMNRRYIPETTQLAGVVERSRIVHLDLDPQNVLLPGLDEPSDGINPAHSDISRLQVADFGSADLHDRLHEVPTTNIARRIAHLRRNRGKPTFWLPEQWTPEWDDMRPTRDPYNRPQSGTIAGNFDSHSNIWHIGMLMRCVLLLDHPPVIPDGGRIEAFEVLPSPGAPVPYEDQFWSCGADLVQDAGTVRLYGKRMCNLIARCLAYVPAHRPTVAEIQREVNRGLAAEPDGGRVSQQDAGVFFDAPDPLLRVAGGRPMDTDIWAGT